MKCFLADMKYPLHGWHGIVQMILPVCYLLIWIPTVVLNFVALLIYLKKDMRMRLSNLFTLNTIIADLCIGFVAVPLVATLHIFIAYFQDYNCLLYAATMFQGYLLCIISFLTVSYASIDRYFAVFKPYYYWSRLAHSFTQCYIIIGATWISSVAIIVSSFFVPDFVPVFMLLAGLNLMILIDIYINVKIWFTVRSIRKTVGEQLIVQTMKFQLEHHNTTSTAYDNNNNNSPRKIERNMKLSNSDGNSGTVSDAKQRRREKENRRLNRSVSLLLVSLCVCYLPFFLVSIIWATPALEDVGETHLIYTVASVGAFLGFFKSVLNPIIYWYSIPSIKKKMKLMLFSCCSQICYKHNQVGVTRHCTKQDAFSV